MRDECVVSPVAKDRDGYPRVKHQRRMWQVGRLIWTLMYGPLEEGELVLHHCDNPGCVNPKHLYKGSLEDNMRDKRVRKRVAGERHPRAKITDEQADEIRRMYDDGGMSQTAIGELFGLGQSQVSLIIKNKRLRGS